MVKWNQFNMSCIVFSCIILFSCRDETRTVRSSYKFITPEYGNITINIANDTIAFPLKENVYNTIKSFNVFNQNGIEYISFYDQRSETINIYDFQKRLLVKNISIKDCFKKRRLFKTTAYIINFDSIFINNITSLYLLDSSGTIRESVDFLKRPKNAWAVFENSNPLIVKNNKAFAAVRPNVDESSFRALRKWKVLYSFDLENKKAVLHYNLPNIYHKNLYGYQFLDFSYCHNNRGNFVFSFPADTNIYETNLDDYHIAYFAKSRFQVGDIKPVKKEEIKQDQGHKQYKLRDSYGAIFFDPFRKRYFRQAKQKISVADYEAKKLERKQSVIVFNEDLKIIGESEITNDFAFSTIIFTSNGNMYARINPRDEYALNFVRLEYKEQGNKMHLAKVDNDIK